MGAKLARAETNMGGEADPLAPERKGFGAEVGTRLRKENCRGA